MLSLHRVRLNPKIFGCGRQPDQAALAADITDAPSFSTMVEIGSCIKICRLTRIGGVQSLKYFENSQFENPQITQRAILSLGWLPCKSVPCGLKNFCNHLFAYPLMTIVTSPTLEAKANPAAPSYISRLTRTYNANDVLFTEGEIGYEMFVVLSGEVEIHKTSGDANVYLGTFKSGDFFGEMALVERGVRTGTATIKTTGTELVAVNQARFVYLVSQQPAFALSVMRKMGNRVEEMNVRLASLSANTAEQQNAQ